MPCDRALNALELLISTDRTSGIVASVDWNALRGVYEARRRRPLFAEIQRRYCPEHERAPFHKSTAPKSNLTRELQNASPVRRRDIVTGHLRSMVANVLGFHPSREIELEHGFFDLGLDSSFRHCVPISLHLRITFMKKRIPWTVRFTPSEEASIRRQKSRIWQVGAYIPRALSN
jgi:hypothetical protein